MSGVADAPRGTPYELVFGEGGFEPRLDEIRAEATARGTDVSDPEQFLMLAEAGRLIRELLPEDADPLSIVDAGRLIFHAFHFRAAGSSTYGLAPPALRYLLEDPAAFPADAAGATSPAADAPEPPAAAGYLQLPRNALWARVAEDAPWEAVDGLFWAVSPGESGAPATGSPGGLHALLVLGMRPDRPGFSVVAVTAERPEGGDWSRVQARTEGEDFGNVLPGGELSGLHALVNGVEVLKLLSRFFRYVSARPEAIEALPPGAGSTTVRHFRVGAGPDGR